jgi:hypothetical protein
MNTDEHGFLTEGNEGANFRQDNSAGQASRPVVTSMEPILSRTLGSNSVLQFPTPFEIVLIFMPGSEI